LTSTLPGAAVLGTTQSGPILPGTAAGVIAAAMSQLRIPYAWGAESPGKGFDCSGLVQWAYSQVGISLPRTSEEQYAATKPVSAASAQPGDLVFSEFGTQGQSGPGHVGIYLGGGQFLDAPYTGVDVRVDSVPSGAVYGRVTGLILNGTEPGQSGTAAASSSSTTSSGSGVGCNAKGGGVNLDFASAIPIVGSVAPKVTVGNACQIKALTGGLCVGLGGGVMLVGAVLIAAYGLSHTSVGKNVAQAAQFTPVGAVVGSVAKVAQ
jgi:NlpC/P60 family